MQNKMLFWGLVIAQFGAVIALTAAVQRMNPDIRIKCLAERVGADTEAIFDDTFFERQAI